MSNTPEQYLRGLISGIDTRLHGLLDVPPHNPTELITLHCPDEEGHIVASKLDYHIVQRSGDPIPRAVFPRIVTADVRDSGSEERERFILEPGGNVTYMGSDGMSSSFNTHYLDAMIGCAEKMLDSLVEVPSGAHWTMKQKSGRWTE